MLAVVYVVLVRLTLATEVLDGHVVAVWPPAGVALAALLRRGLGLWPGVLTGAWVGNLLGSADALGALGEAAGATLGVLVAASVVRRVAPDLRLDRLSEVLGLVAAAVCGAMVSALVGVTSVWVEGTMVWDSWSDGFLLWSLGDLEGMLVVAPLLLGAGLLRETTTLRRAAGATAAIAVLTALAVLIFREPDGQLWMLMPACIWIAMRHGVFGTLAASLCLALVAVAATDAGLGPFEHGAPLDLVRAQTFAIISSASLLIVAAVTAERRRALAEHRRMAAEDAALRRVATAVAGAASVDDVCVRTGREIATLLGVEVGVVARFGDDPARARALGEWGTSPVLPGKDGSLELVTGGVLAAVRATGVTVRIDERDGDGTFPPFTQRVAAPVHVDGRTWGALMACTSRTDALDPDAESRLQRFAELVGLAFANAESRARLIDEATTDALTGLHNHRAFHERLAEHAALAQSGTPVSVVVFDVDRFKDFNDGFGHERGDDLLRDVAEQARRAARGGEVVARIGGDEFALLLVGDRVEAHAAAERLRAAVAEHVSGVTLSAGVADSELSDDPRQLLALADGALYWAKMHGRDATCVYDPDVVEELSSADRVERLERTKALGAVRALAKAIDAKDEATTRHSERVADLAARLAEACGWGPRDVARLRDAGLVHDVGKIGVADATLTKPGCLTAEEYEAIKVHSELSAQIVAEVLDAEQTAWVRGHHERHDGGGYPDGLSGDELSEGARLLVLADAWDAMTGARVYSPPMAPQDALREVVACTGTQFHPDAVRALHDVLGRPAPELEPAGPRGMQSR